MNCPIHDAKLLALVAVCLCVFVPPVVAQECPEPVGSMSEPFGLFRWPGGDDVRTVALSGEYAYLGGGSEFLVADVSDPASPELVSWITWPGGGWEAPESVYAIAVSGQLAFVATSEALHVIDVTTPSRPLELGSVELPGFAHDIAVVAGHAYIVGGGGEGHQHVDGYLRVIDVSTPSRPRPEASLEANWWLPTAIDVAEGHAYVADRWEGLRVFDVTVPSAPMEVGRKRTAGEPTDVKISEALAYVSIQNEGLYVIDVSDPSAPMQLGSLETSSNSVGVAMSDGFAYLLDGDAGVRVIDVSTPSIPVQRGFIDTPGDGSSIALAGSDAYIADGAKGLCVIDVADPSSPVLKGALGTVVGTGVAAADGYAFVAVNGLWVLDVNPPSAPAQVSSLPNSTYFADVAVSDRRVYAVSGAGLHVIDLSEPTTPLEIGFLPLDDRVEALEVSEHYVYAAGDGLHVIDVSVPSLPVEVSFLPKIRARDITLENGYLYTIGDGFNVIDINDAFAPAVVSSLDEWGEAVTVVNGHAYVASGYVVQTLPGCNHRILIVVDVSAPSEPVTVGWFEFTGCFGDYQPSVSLLSLRGNVVLYVVQNGLHVLDVAQPSSPIEVGSAYVPDFRRVEDVAVSGRYAHALGCSEEDGCRLFTFDIWDCRYRLMPPVVE